MNNLKKYQKLLYIQSNLKVPKNQYNRFGNFNYRSCEDILTAVKPIAQKVKAVVIMTDGLTLIGDRVYIEATAKLVDAEDGQLIASATAYAREGNPSKKKMDEMQMTGAASSYARKYALNGLFAIDDNKDADDYHNPNEMGNNGGRQQNRPPQQNYQNQQQQRNNNRTITQKQMNLLFARANQKGWDNNQLLMFIGNYGYDSVPSIQMNDFNNILEGLNNAK